MVCTRGLRLRNFVSNLEQLFYSFVFEAKIFDEYSEHVTHVYVLFPHHRFDVNSTGRLSTSCRYLLNLLTPSSCSHHTDASESQQKAGGAEGAGHVGTGGGKLITYYCHRCC